MKVLSVSFAKGRADVIYDPGKVTVEQMVQALGRYRFTASPMGG